MLKKIAEKAGVTQKHKPKTRPVFDDTEVGQGFQTFFYDRQRPLQPLFAVILKTLFNDVNYKKAASEVFSGVKNSKAVCGKIFTKQDIAFKCFDCEKDNTCVICKDCYEKGNHKGHRVLVQKSVSGCCDCGDPDAWNENGFCSDHPGYANFKPTYSIDDIPADFKERFIQVFEKCFYYLFNLYEEYAITKQEDMLLLTAIDEVAGSILIALDFCGETSMALWLLLCQLFKTKLSQNNRELYAKTSDLKTMSFGDIPKLCDFTYLECILYFHQLNGSKIQNKFEEMCIKLFLDYEFKIYIAETYIKMIYFIFPSIPTSPTDPSKSFMHTKITGLNVQLFTAEEFAIVAMNSPHFLEFMDLFEEIIKSFINHPGMGAFETVMDYYSFFLFTTQKQPSRLKYLYKEGVISKVLNWFNLLNYSFKLDVTKKHNLNPNDVDSIALLIDVEYKLLQIIDHLFVELSLDEDVQRKNAMIELISNEFVNIIKKNDIASFKDRAEFDKYRTLHIPFYRAFVLFIKNILEQPTIASLDNLVKDQMKISGRNLEIIAFFLFKMAFRTLTFPIDNEKKSFPFHSPLFDLFSTMYRNPKLKFFDCDVLILQFSLLYIHGEDFCMGLESSVSVNTTFRKLFTSIQSGNFDQTKFERAVGDLKRDMEDAANKAPSPILKHLKSFGAGGDENKENRHYVLLDEFFNVLIMLCIDEIALANLFYQKNKMFETPKNPEFCFEVYKNVFINLFQKQNKLTFKAIREILANRVAHEKAEIEGGLNDVAIFNSQTKTFQVKDQYSDVYEPFIFIRDPQLLVETHQNIQNKLKAEKRQADFIVGKRSYVYEYKNSILNKVQEKLFSFPLIEFAVHCLINSKELTKTSGIITRPVLKFLHMALNYALHFKNKTLMTKLATAVDSQNLAERLKELRNDNDCSDMHQGIDKIADLIGKVQLECSVKSISMAEEPGPVELTSKNSQEAIKNRMSQIKQQFSQKREAFLKKFKHEIVEDNTNEEMLLCYICHSEIKPDTEYGIPAFFSESSVYNLAFSKCKKRQADMIRGKDFEEETKVSFSGHEQLEKEASRSYPVITTCSHNFHYIHKDCFEKHSRKRTDSEQNSGFIYSNDLEYSCSLCKSLCNVFVMERKAQPNKPDAENEGNIDVEINDIAELIEKVSTFKAISQESKLEPDPIFNDVMLLEILNENVNSKVFESEPTGEDHILVTFDTLLAQSCHTVTFGGLEYFMKYKYSLYRSLRDSYQQFYKVHSSSTKIAYYNIQKGLLSKYLGILFADTLRNYEAEGDELLFRDSQNLKLTLLSSPDEFLFEVMQHLVISSDLSPKLQNQFIIRVMRIYLLHKMVQVYMKKKLVRHDLQEFTFETFMKDLSFSGISTTKEELANGLLPTLRKVVVFMLLNCDLSKESISTLSNGDYLNDEEEINNYLKLEGLNTTSANFLSTKVFSYVGISEEIVQKWINNARNELKMGIKSISPYVLMVDQDVMLSFVDLPETYYELSTTYIEKKCEICNDHSHAGNRCICLLCGMVLCSVKCKKIDAPIQLGNLNNHSILQHAGESAFVNVETGKIYLINTPKNIDYCSLYVDRFGYGLEDKGRDWKSFKLDKTCLDTMREKFIYEKLPQEITYNIINNSKKLYDSLL